MSNMQEPRPLDKDNRGSHDNATEASCACGHAQLLGAIYDLLCVALPLSLGQEAELLQLHRRRNGGAE